MDRMKKQTYVFHEILRMLEPREQMRMQLISRRFYEKLVPFVMEECSVRSAPFAVKQDCLYQYASGYIMYRRLSDVVHEAEKSAQSSTKWTCIPPSNPDYAEKHGLNKTLKFGRTLYLPYQRLLVISGSDFAVGPSSPVKDVFEFDLLTRRVEKKMDICVGRTSFAAHYDFGDRYVYVIGGCNEKDSMIADCERYDLWRDRWELLPNMTQARSNPGTILTADKQWIYAFQGFINDTNEEDGVFF